MVKKVAQTPAAKSALKPLYLHNAERERAWFDMLALPDLSVRPNGIACPECYSELQDAYPVILHYPPRFSVSCSVCGWRGGRVA